MQHLLPAQSIVAQNLSSPVTICTLSSGAMVPTIMHWMMAYGLVRWRRRTIEMVHHSVARTTRLVSALGATGTAAVARVHHVTSLVGAEVSGGWGARQLVDHPSYVNPCQESTVPHNRIAATGALAARGS